MERIEDEDPLEFLHDATINELSVNHDEAEEFHEYLVRTYSYVTQRNYKGAI